MADKNNYLTRVTYQGGKDSYEFPFSYLRKNFVKAQIDLSERESNTLAYMVDYTIDGHTLNLTKPVDADKTITIYRETSSTPLVEYEDSSILRAYDLNLSQRQNLNILEEQTDIVGKNYSLSQDTKDYMYKNLMDTKTAIDNKMSETLDTVNASVSTMNDAINTATSSMDSKISQASQALEDAKANLETTKSDIEKALADTQDSMKATENRVNETKADITKLAAEFKESESSLQDAIKIINTTNRNMTYEVGEQIHSSYLPFNCYITCVTAGTTGDTLPVIPEGNHDSGFTYMDGTATFKMDYWPLSINGKKPLNKAGDITLNVDKVKEAERADTASSVAWSGVTGKPETYPPSMHNHDSAYPSVTGTRASGTWGINISGNAASATNVDKLDGYHASDILNRITAANTGGIVAASLTSNGYVKFANGLILQWGNASGRGDEDTSTTFPIAFPYTCFVVLLTTKNFLGYNRLISQRNADFTWSAEGGHISWVAIGS